MSVASQTNGAQQHSLMNTGSRILPRTEPKRPNVMISSNIIVLERERYIYLKAKQDNTLNIPHLGGKNDDSYAYYGGGTHAHDRQVGGA